MTEKKREFFDYIKLEEIRLRIDFWKNKVKNECFSKYISLQKIETLRTQLSFQREQIGYLAQSVLENAFLVDFIYNSNKIEGSKVPRIEVQRKVKEGSMGMDEVSNTLRALYFVDKKFRFTKPQIKKLHQILLQHEPAKHGFRKEKVVVGNEHVSEWKHILLELDKLLMCTRRYGLIQRGTKA